MKASFLFHSLSTSGSPSPRSSVDNKSNNDDNNDISTFIGDEAAERRMKYEKKYGLARSESIGIRS